jgi:hypothetical protein
VPLLSVYPGVARVANSAPSALGAASVIRRAEKLALRVLLSWSQADNETSPTAKLWARLIQEKYNPSTLQVVLFLVANATDALPLDRG